VRAWGQFGAQAAKFVEQLAIGIFYKSREPNQTKKEKEAN
jgi:hypothetical protein